MSKKKVNPRRIPLSKADEHKAFLDGAESAIRLANFLMREKMGFDNETVKKFNSHFSAYMTQIVRGEISPADIEAVLKDEYRLILDIRH